mmetsp:Transcript_14018/g.46027  ORF Transcript_14018/g.46027 Transcript_14018/m.46027 type:complete len:260 (+) Transcript_14018:1650-2429(+)
MRLAAPLPHQELPECGARAADPCAVAAERHGGEGRARDAERLERHKVGHLAQVEQAVGKPRHHELRPRVVVGAREPRRLVEEVLLPEPPRGDAVPVPLERRLRRRRRAPIEEGSVARDCVRAFRGTRLARKCHRHHRILVPAQSQRLKSLRRIHGRVQPRAQILPPREHVSLVRGPRHSSERGVSPTERALQLERGHLLLERGRGPHLQKLAHTHSQEPARRAEGGGAHGALHPHPMQHNPFPVVDEVGTTLDIKRNHV